jgi:hypothetical protein
MTPCSCGANHDLSTRAGLADHLAAFEARTDPQARAVVWHAGRPFCECGRAMRRHSRGWGCPSEECYTSYVLDRSE